MGPRAQVQVMQGPCDESKTGCVHVPKKSHGDMMHISAQDNYHSLRLLVLRCQGTLCLQCQIYQQEEMELKSGANAGYSQRSFYTAWVVPRHRHYLCFLLHQKEAASTYSVSCRLHQGRSFWWYSMQFRPICFINEYLIELDPAASLHCQTVPMSMPSIPMSCSAAC